MTPRYYRFLEPPLLSRWGPLTDCTPCLVPTAPPSCTRGSNENPWQLTSTVVLTLCLPTLDYVPGGVYQIRVPTHHLKTIGSQYLSRTQTALTVVFFTLLWWNRRVRKRWGTFFMTSSVIFVRWTVQREDLGPRWVLSVAVGVVGNTRNPVDQLEDVPYLRGPYGVSPLRLFSRIREGTGPNLTERTYYDDRGWPGSVVSPSHQEDSKPRVLSPRRTRLDFRHDKDPNDEWWLME